MPGRFNVCGRTTSTDAAGLPASLGAGGQQPVRRAAAAPPSCVGTVAVAAINTDACVPVTCPGGAPFDITVTLKDAAGNPTTTTIQGVSCASTLPSVQIITPVSDAPAFNDPVAAHPVGDRARRRARPGSEHAGRADRRRRLHRSQRHRRRCEVGLSGGTLTALGSPSRPSPPSPPTTARRASASSRASPA